MLSELIKPQQRIGAERLVEEVAENAGDGGAAEEAEVHDDELYASQSLSSEIAAVQERSSTQCGYGFAWLRHGVLGKFAGEIKGLIDIEKPDEMRVEERAEVTKELDTRSFDVEHYLYVVLFLTNVQPSSGPTCSIRTMGCKQRCSFAWKRSTYL